MKINGAGYSFELLSNKYINNVEAKMQFYTHGALLIFSYRIYKCFHNSSQQYRK